jgi:hypothetical protein
MSLPLAITAIVLADLALIAGLSYVMSRAKLLTPHISSSDAATPKPRAATRSARPVRRTAHARGAAIGVEG